MKIRRSVLKSLLCLPVAAVAAGEDWQLVFYDDFNTGSVDAAKWSKFDYVNWNVADWRKFQSQDDALYQSNDDSLTLWGRYGDYTSQSDPTGSANGYACAGLNTQGKFSFQYGKVEVRAKFDSVQGVWPAIWMLPTNPVSWLGSGEIDLMEHLNYEGSAHQTLHYKANDGTNASSYTTVNKAYSDLHVGDKNQWHTYGVEWTENAITFSIDGVNTATFTSDGENNWPFDNAGNEFYLIVDQQIGGSWVESLGDKGINKNRLAGAGAAFEIDSVRVYSTTDYTADSLKDSFVLGNTNEGTEFARLDAPAGTAAALDRAIRVEGDMVFSAGATLALEGATASVTNKGVTISGKSGAESALSGTTNNAPVEVKNADVNVSADATGNVSLSAQLTNSSITNATNGTTLTLDCAGTAVSFCEAKATEGDITFTNAGEIKLTNLTIGENCTVAAYRDASLTEAQEATIIVAANRSATFQKGATLLANLTIYNNAAITMSGALTLGSSLILNGGETLVLINSDIISSGSALLFDSVEALTLRDLGATTVTEGRYDASSVFGSITADGQALLVSDYDIVYHGGRVSLLDKSLAPEPATATLSLLALAALAARRRR